MSSVSFVMLVICIFFYSLSWQRPFNFIDLYKEPTLGFIDFSQFFSCFNFIDFCSNSYYFFTSAWFGFNFLFFYNFQSWKQRLLILHPSFLLLSLYSKFSCKHCFHYILQFVCSFSSKFFCPVISWFMSSLPLWLNCMCFDLFQLSFCYWFLA